MLSTRPCPHCYADMQTVVLQGRIRYNEDGVKKIQFIIVENYRPIENGEGDVKPRTVVTGVMST